jgi:hypothetical protein
VFDESESNRCGVATTAPILSAPRYEPIPPALTFRSAGVCAGGIVLNRRTRQSNKDADDYGSDNQFHREGRDVTSSRRLLWWYRTGPSVWLYKISVRSTDEPLVLLHKLRPGLEQPDGWQDNDRVVGHALNVSLGPLSWSSQKQETCRSKCGYSTAPPTSDSYVVRCTIAILIANRRIQL